MRRPEGAAAQREQDRRRAVDAVGAVGAVVLATTYAFAAWVTLTHPTVLALAWPSAGVAALWIGLAWGRPRRAVAVVSAVLALTVLVYVVAGSGAPRGAAVGLLAVITAAVTGAVLHRLLGPVVPGGAAAGSPWTLRRPADLVTVLVASAAGGLVPALVGPGLLRVADGDDLPLVMWPWLLKAAVSTFVVVTAGLRVRAGARALAARGSGSPRLAPSLPRLGEAGLVLGALVASHGLVAARGDADLLVLTLLPVALWAGLRLPTTWVALLGLANAVTVVALADAAPGVWLPAGDTVSTAQVLVAVLTFCVLALALHRDALADASTREHRWRRDAEEQAQLLATVLRNAHEGIMVVDATGRVVVDNATTRGLLGVPQGSSRSIRRRSYAVLGEDHVEVAEADLPLVRALAGERVADEQLLIRRADGGESWVTASARPLPGMPGRHGAVLTLHDSTGERRAARALEDSERRVREALESSPLGMLVVRLDDGSSVVRTNPALQRLLGRPVVVGTEVTDLVDATDRPVLRSSLRALAAGLELTRLDVRLRHADGRRLHCACAPSVVTGPDGAREAVLLLEDVSDREKRAAELAHRASHDALTGLPNRALLVERLDALLHPSSLGRAGERVGLVYVDLDGFKEVNDSEGHAVGDAVLTEVARRLSSTVRPGDTVARLGGDELVVVCPGLTGHDDLAVIASRVVEELGAPYDPPARHHGVSASAGAALADLGDSATTLLARADAAMYAAKRDGGDRWVPAPAGSTGGTADGTGRGAPTAPLAVVEPPGGRPDAAPAEADPDHPDDDRDPDPAHAGAPVA